MSKSLLRIGSLLCIVIAVGVVVWVIQRGKQSDIPIPFMDGGAIDLRGQLTTIGRKQSIDVVRVTFPAGTDTETLQQDRIYLVSVPDDPNVPSIPLDQAIAASGGGTVDYFGYKYLSVDAAVEKQNREDTSFLVRFPGQFFASAKARTGISSGTIVTFEQRTGITMHPTDTGGVMLEGNALYLIVVNEAQSVTITVRQTPQSPVCGNRIIESGETCDDNNTTSGDGCSDTCAVESGWACSGEPSICTPISAAADLSLSMRADPDRVQAGGVMSFTADIHNAGSGSAQNVAFSGALPSGLVYQSAAGATCTMQSGALTCGLGAMASGENKAIVLTVKTLTGSYCIADQLQSFTGSVFAVSPSDPQLSNNTAVAAYTDICSNILRVVSAHLTPVNVQSGGYVPLAELTARVQNVSPSATENTVVTVPVSEALSFRSASGGMVCSIAVGQISCNLGTLQAGETKSLGLLFDVNILADPLCDYDTPSTIATSLSALSDTSDPIPGDNNYSVSMTTLCPSDAAIVSADFDPKDLSEATLTVVVKNNGPGIATRIVTMPVPANLTPLYLYNNPCSTSYGNVSCPTGWLLPGQTRTFKIPFHFADTASCVASRKTLAFDIHDTNQSNDTYQVTVKPWNNCTVGDRADLDIAIQKPQLLANQKVTYPMAVWNIGRVNASSVFVMHTLSNGETFVSAQGASCSVYGDQLECGIGNIAYNDHTSFSITLQYSQPQPCGQVENRFATFNVVSGTSEVNTGNNQSTAFFESACPTDWGMVSAQFSPAAVPPATDTALSVRVQNSGPATDNALVSVSGMAPTFFEHDMPPLCFSFPDTDTIDWGARVFTCWVGNLASGETKDLSLGFVARGDPQNTCIADYSPVVTTSVYGHGYDPNSTNASLRPSVTWDCPQGQACSNGTKEGAEQCDDGNTAPNDGCSNTCSIESGWTCTGTSPSTCSPVCGDGLKKGTEACDDHNLNNNDGCSSTCQIETGWICTGVQPSSCTKCGNGVIDSDRGEVCDYADPNVPPGECDQSCRFTVPIPEF
ncbi:MAG: DUF4215 domain-containing protein [Candidatus Peribacteraceae bacterium]